MTIFVEGGGDIREAQTRLKKGFVKFFAKMFPDRAKPVVSPCGGRGETYRNFCIGLSQLKEGDFALLLVDSESPIRHDADPWEHCRDRQGDKWELPDPSARDLLHLMVQTMESWFLAHPDAVAGFYGKGFKKGKLPSPVNGKDIECIDKDKVLKQLDAALKEVNKDGYQKEDGFEIIGLIEPHFVCFTSKFAQRLRDKLDEILPGR